jgi:hypothetical protein
MRKPSRRDLLVVIGRLQQLVGSLGSAANDDRNPERATFIIKLTKEAHDLCVAARSFDPPIEARLGPWSGR